MCVCIHLINKYSFQTEEIDMNFFWKEMKKENPFYKRFYAAFSSSTSRDILKISFMYELLKNEGIICAIYLCNTTSKDNFV